MKAFLLCTSALERWLDEADTDPDLTNSIVEYVQRRGTVMMEEAISEAPPRFRPMALSQDKIGWRRFLEGDDIKGDHIYTATILRSQRVTYESGKVVLRIDYPAAGDYIWAVALPNYVVHDPVSGTIATAKKEELLLEIERQHKLGDARLLEEDKYLAEVKQEEMASSLGERQHYWLLAIQTAWNHYELRAQQESQQTVRGNITGE